MTFTVLAWWRAQRGCGTELEPLLATMQQSARKEPGCHEYEVHRSQDDPDTFLLYEVYRDADAYAAHAASEIFVTVGKEQAMPLLEERRREFHTRLQPTDGEA